MATIPDKAAYYELAWRRRLGNTLREWPNAQAVAADGYDGLVAVRTRYKANGPFWPNLSLSDAVLRVHELVRSGVCRPDQAFYAEMDTAGGDRVLTAYVMRTERGLHVEYSREPRMLVRDAMRKDHHAGNAASGLAALCLLRSALPPEDMDDLDELMAEYPGATVELTVFERPLGWANRRTVFWEVRDY